MGADVTESHEPSYYEIALTNRQVLVAFVILLVCLLAAFLSGVWVGRDNSTVQAAAGAPPAAPAAGQEKPLAEYRFFSEEGKRPGAPTGAVPAPPTAKAPPLEPDPGPGTTLLDDVGGAPAADRAGQPAAAAPAPAPGDEEPGAPPAPPAAEPIENPPASPALAAPPAAEPGGGEMVIQVFSSPDEPQAKRILERLAGAGFAAFLSPVRVGNQTMHRVRIGPFTDRAEAQRIADQVKQQFRLDTWITR